VKENGGLTIVQDPKTAEMDFLPKSAMLAVSVDYILPLDAIGGFLSKMGS
jgi:two-component system chemotaxis response regulator CheB